MFLFELADRKQKTINEILKLSHTELVYWAAYYKINLLDDPYLRTGLICSTMANCWSNKKFKPSDFMPTEEANKPVKNDKALAAALNNFFKKKKRS